MSEPTPSEVPAGQRPTADRPTDLELLTRAGVGEREAFEALVTRHEDGMYRFARHLTASEQDAEDALQEALLSAWRSARNYRGAAEVRTWLFQILVNACHRRGRRRAGEPAAHEDLAATRSLPADDPAPDAVAAAGELQQVLEKALGAMAPEASEVILLRDVEGLSGEEVAGALAISLAAMKSRLHRARLELKSRVEGLLGRALA
jgi:RNA polymerase sigma-70 factor (ECF subfamily)